MKKSLSIVALLLMLGLQAKAQVFIADEEEYINSNRNVKNESELPFIPELGVTNDQYAPLGGGIAVLGLLGGAYLVGKRRNARNGEE